MNTYFKRFTKEELEREQWRDIDGYDGMYQVSDLGRVRSKKYGRWKVLKGRKDKDGYLLVCLCKGGKAKNYKVHRLVAQAFIPNDDESKTIINHIDNSDKQNNRASNLEWCDYQYNNTYDNIHLRRKNSKRIKLKDLYDPNLSSKENIDIFKANGIECCRQTILRLRKDLGLIK